jgi:hypothetical protein
MTVRSSAFAPGMFELQRDSLRGLPSRRGRRPRRLVLGCLVLFSVVASGFSRTSLFAQEGHPLVGTWYGEWGPSPQERHDVTIIMSWDGKKIDGTIDPGPDAVPFKTATLDSSSWTVHIEAERAAKANVAAARYVIDGKISNLGSYNRTLTGTWTQGTTKGDFKLTRD